MFSNAVCWLGKWGILLGLLVIFAPIAYDIVGVAYGRDLHVKVEFVGALFQMAGIVVVMVTAGIRKWAGDSRIF